MIVNQQAGIQHQIVTKNIIYRSLISNNPPTLAPNPSLLKPFWVGASGLDYQPPAL